MSVGGVVEIASLLTILPCFFHVGYTEFPVETSPALGGRPLPALSAILQRLGRLLMLRHSLIRRFARSIHSFRSRTRCTVRSEVPQSVSQGWTNLWISVRCAGLIEFSQP